MKRIALIFACFLFFSCSEKKTEEIPVNILSKQKMSEVMLDLHLLEASMSLNAVGAESTTAVGPSPNYDVLKKNKISKTQYDESFDYYSKHPAILVEIYEHVLNDLSKMQAEVTNKN